MRADRRRAGRLVAAVAVVAAVCAGAAQAAPVDVSHPENLPRGANARLLFADGSRIHTLASGLVALPASDQGMRLLGKPASGGWLAWDYEVGGDPFAFRNTLYLIGPDGAASVVYQRVTPWVEFNDLGFWYGLSQNGHRIVEWLADEGDGVLTVRNLAGDVVGTGRSATRVLDFSGPRIAYLDNTWAYVWRIGHKPRLVTTRTSDFADLQRNVIFLQTPDGRFGPTRLSAPVRVRWRARFEAIRLSPDGMRVLGRTPTSSAQRPVFQIRRMSDGAVLSSFKAGNPRQGIAWEGNRAVLFPAYRADGRVAVVRCQVAGRCTRASGWLRSKGGLTFPYTPQY